jgi:uncharacterized protein
MALHRREFITGACALAVVRPGAHAQSERGGPVVDCHHHPRRTPEANTAHLDGAGITNAMLLARGDYSEQFAALRAKYPGRYLGWFGSTDARNADAPKLLEQALKNGAIGLGEMKSHVAAAGPEMDRLYRLAADFNVPVLIHFQEVDHYPGEGTWNTGFKNFEAVLRRHPKTKFIGHADAFWANVSADYANQEAYPSGRIVRGGITDKLLGDYANLFGDLAANSGNNALSRDPEFTPDFLRRHQDKLIFGSDCSCADGKGGGVSQANNPAAKRIAGRCVARETLTLLKNTATPAMFRKMTWDNAHRIYRLSKG